MSFQPLSADRLCGASYWSAQEGKQRKQLLALPAWQALPALRVIGVIGIPGPGGIGGGIIDIIDGKGGIICDPVADPTGIFCLAAAGQGAKITALVMLKMPKVSQEDVFLWCFGKR